MKKNVGTLLSVLFLTGVAFGAVSELREGEFTVKPNYCPGCPKRMRFTPDGKTAFINTSLVSEKDFLAEAERAFKLMKSGEVVTKDTSIAKGAVTLNVTPLPGDSHTTGTGLNRSLNSSTIGSRSRTKTTRRNMKWRAEVRIRENRPEKLEMKVFYIATTGEGKLKELGKETKAVQLDKNGRATIELTSPTASLTKSRTTVSRGSGFGGLGSGFRSTKSSIRGERVSGCVIQVFADGELVKAWSSDSRWTKAAENENFSVSELEKNKSKIGLR